MSPTATATRIVLDRRFDGSRVSADGGYACGRVARFVDGPAEVTLHRPVPLDTALDVERHDDGRVTLRHGGVLLAEAEPALPLDEVEPPRRPTLAAPLIADAPVPHGEDGSIAPEILWAALGAPPSWAHGEPSVVTRMTAELIEPIGFGSPAVVVGWSLADDGREHTRATALLAADGRMLGRARALWMRLPASA